MHNFILPIKQHHTLFLHLHITVYTAVFIFNVLSQQSSAHYSPLKLFFLHFQGLRPTFVYSPFLWPGKTLMPSKSPCRGVPTAANNSTLFLFYTNVQLQLYLYLDWSSGRKDKIVPAHAMKTQEVVEVQSSSH